MTVGYKRAATSLVPPGVPPPYNAAYRLLHPEPRRRPAPLDQHLRHFDAKYVDYLWHTDLHQLTSSTDAQGLSYIIAFIDDASRYLMGYEIITDKTAQTAARVLQSILEAGCVPRVMGSDNEESFVVMRLLEF
jgi:hypothetical protein